MGLALDEAYLGIKDGDGGPFGACIVRNGEILAEAHNTVLKSQMATKHAEMNAIEIASRKLGSWNLQGATLFTTTEPCPMCFSAIHWAKIDRVYFGTRIGDVAALGFNELMVSAVKMKEIGKSRIEIIPGFMVDECMELLYYYRDYFPRASRY